MDCDEIHGSFEDISGDLCLDGVNEWSLLYGAQMAVIVVLLMSKCCVCTKKQRQSLRSLEVEELSEVEFPSSHRRGSGFYDGDLPEELGQSMEGGFGRNEKRRSKGSEGVDRVFGDDDVRECLKYLLANLSECDAVELDEKAEELKRSGYGGNGKPLNGDMVRKSMSIFKNYRTNQDSAFIHPLMKGLV